MTTLSEIGSVSLEDWMYIFSVDPILTAIAGLLTLAVIFLIICLSVSIYYGDTFFDETK